MSTDARLSTLPGRSPLRRARLEQRALPPVPLFPNTYKSSAAKDQRAREDDAAQAAVKNAVYRIFRTVRTTADKVLSMEDVNDDGASTSPGAEKDSKRAKPNED